MTFCLKRLLNIDQLFYPLPLLNAIKASSFVLYLKRMHVFVFHSSSPALMAATARESLAKMSTRISLVFFVLIIVKESKVPTAEQPKYVFSSSMKLPSQEEVLIILHQHVLMGIFLDGNKPYRQNS